MTINKRVAGGWLFHDGQVSSGGDYEKPGLEYPGGEQRGNRKEVWMITVADQHGRRGSDPSQAAHRIRVRRPSRIGIPPVESRIVSDHFRELREKDGLNPCLREYLVAEPRRSHRLNGIPGGLPVNRELVPADIAADKDERLHYSRLGQGEIKRYAAAHREPHKMGVPDPKMIEQVPEIISVRVRGCRCR